MIGLRDLRYFEPEEIHISEEILHKNIEKERFDELVKYFELLNSNFVRANLHYWIELAFGWKSVLE